MRENNIINIILTSGIIYDDRLRKQTKSQCQLGLNPYILALEKENIFKEGLVFEKIPYKTLKIFSNKIANKKLKFPLKILETSIKCIGVLFKVKPAKIVIHDLEMSFLIPILFLMRRLNFIKLLVWDQHELPPEWIIRNKFLKFIFGMFYTMVDNCIVANEERKEYLLRNFSNVENEKLSVVNNYVDIEFIELPKGNLPSEVIEWLKGEQYLLAQGGGSPGRNLEELITAVIKNKIYKLIVIGGYDEKMIERLSLKYALKDMVFFTGQIPQEEIPKYIDNCVASVILYRESSHNNKYCAPNRLFQALGRNKLVLVGGNLTMKNIVNNTGSGYVLESDGENITDILNGIKKIANVSSRKVDCSSQLTSLNWESQNEVLKQIYSK